MLDSTVTIFDWVFHLVEAPKATHSLSEVEALGQCHPPQSYTIQPRGNLRGSCISRLLNGPCIEASLLAGCVLCSERTSWQQRVRHPQTDTFWSHHMQLYQSPSMIESKWGWCSSHSMRASLSSQSFGSYYHILCIRVRRTSCRIGRQGRNDCVPLARRSCSRCWVAHAR